MLEGAKPTEQVELPVTIGPARWRRLEIRVSFKAPLARPHLLVVPFWWLLGLHRRYLELCLQNQSEMLQSRALTVLL